MKKNIIFVLFSFTLYCSVSAQFPELLPPNGGNKKASVTEAIGITDITINYHRPGVRGREGRIWGTVVQYGFGNFSFIGMKGTAPWRGGANESTTITFEHDVKVEGKDLPAGTYGMYFGVWPDSAIVIFSKDYKAWGSFYYDEKLDAARVTVKTKNLDQSVEWLKYEFVEQKSTSAVIALMWEKLMIPFKVEVDVDKIVIDNFREELKGPKGFAYQSWMNAASYCVNAKKNLEEALTWADNSMSGFWGQKNYSTLSTKANVLAALGRQAESDSNMLAALEYATSAFSAYNYGRTLISQKRIKEAMDVFLKNEKKYVNDKTTSNDFYVALGLARGYSASGDYKKALTYAEKALTKLPSEQLKPSVETMIQKLKEGKDVN